MAEFDRYDMNKDIDHVLVSEEQIKARVAEMGAQLSEEYQGKDPILVCILRGAVYFFADLSRHMTCRAQLDFMSISSYGDECKTSGIVRIVKDLDASITGRHVLIIEDIMDSGHTLKHLKKVLMAREPASLKICCLLDKPSRRECDITPDYTGFVIPNEFVLGYGLDFANYYRNMPYVGVLKPELYK